MKLPLLALTLALTALPAIAKDHGVQGNTWPIVEQDIRQMLVESASKADWSKVQGQLKDSAENFLEKLPKRQLPLADKTQTEWFDPSIVLTSDIQVPVKQANGTYIWQVMYPKGTRVNPFEKYRPVTAMLFFDGSQEEQLKFVQEVLAKEPNRIVPVEAGAGNLKEMNETLKRPVFHANDAMINRFQVKYLPALAYPGEGEHRLYLGVTSFGPPFKAQEAIAAWPALAPSAPSTAKKAQ